MRNVIIGSLFALALGASAHAQDFGITAGLSGSNATAKVSGQSAGSTQFGFRAGGVASFPLTDSLKFRTGVMYSQRHFVLSDTAGNSATASFEYIDVPVLAQYNFNDSFGIFGGIIAAINVNNSVNTSNFVGGGTSSATGTNGFYPLVQVGVNGTFDNMYGVEAYYEMGMGSIYDGAKNYSVFGANFIYWL